MTTVTEFAISWPTMFGIPAAPFALFESKVAPTSSTYEWNTSPRKNREVKTVVVPAPVFFGPLTTRVGTVVFGNVTKRLYHRYFCTTRNW